jgi:hypothetical protein
MISRPDLRRPSASLSPGVYSDTVLSPIKQETYSPNLGSPRTHNTPINTDYRPKSLADSRSGFQPVQQFQPTGFRQQQTEHWQEAKPYPSSLLGRSSSQDSPPILPPTLTHQDSTISTDSGKATPVDPNTRILPPISSSNSGMPSSTRSMHPLDMVSPPGNVGLPSIPGHNIIADVQRGPSGMTALLRASEMARNEAMKEGPRRTQRIIVGRDQMEDEGDS